MADQHWQLSRLLLRKLQATCTQHSQKAVANRIGVHPATLCKWQWGGRVYLTELNHRRIATLCEILAVPFEQAFEAKS